MAAGKYNIVLLEGDGVGRPLAKAAGELLELLAKRFGFSLSIDILPFGKGAWQTGGDAIPPQTLEGIHAADAALLFGVDNTGIPGATPVGRLRRELGLFADLRPICAFPGRWALKEEIDIICVREISEGFLSDRNMYAGAGEFMPDGDTALSLRVITYAASRRIADYAFAYARAKGRGLVTALHKEPIFKLTCGTFLRACRDAAAQHPDIRFTEEQVDSAAGGLIAHPERYDVLLTTNLFGDIITDEAAALVSFLAPSANIGENGAIFLPVSHGPRYDALADGSYDMLPAVLCIVSLMEHLGETQAAAGMLNAARAAARVSGGRGEPEKISAVQRLLREEMQRL